MPPWTKIAIEVGVLAFQVAIQGLATFQRDPVLREGTGSVGPGRHSRHVSRASR
jgi:hypothetical protein